MINSFTQIYKRSAKSIVAILVIAVFFSGCSSNDDAPSIDLDLLYGQWFRVGLCQSQNNLLLNSDRSFVSFSSGAVDCDDPAPDTYKVTGTYAINGRFYSSEVLTQELVIDGTDLTETEFPNPDIRTEIKELTETSLIFRSYIDRGNNITEELGEFTYER